MRRKGPSAPVRIVLQARYTSRRLPGKALLPIGDYPMVVLAALRLGSAGYDVVVATSVKSEDDAIASACERFGLRVVRGPLDNVYERFVVATADLPPTATVVRATADNVLPDGDLIVALLERFWESGSAYLCPRWPEDGLPYGVVAEVFKLGHFRTCRPADDYGKEHVTTAMAQAATMRNPGFATHLPYADVRATVDTPEDYARLKSVVRPGDAMLRIGWEELTRRLAGMPEFVVQRRFKGSRLLSGLTLGTAQLGMPYGIANVGGQPDVGEARDILAGACQAGVTHIDTARAYGESESRLGQLLHDLAPAPSVYTKLAPIPADASGLAVLVAHSIDQSLAALQSERLDGVLLHRASNATQERGAVWSELLRLQSDGKIGKIGVSVQSPAELAVVQDLDGLDVVQLPFNMLDHRWGDAISGLPDTVAIFVRSVLLQGLLSGGVAADKWPVVGREAAQGFFDALQRCADELERTSIADLAIAAVRAQPWADSLVLGMETARQMRENCEHFARAPLTPDEAAWLQRHVPRLPDRVLDPAQW